MAIDLANEQLIGMSEAAELLPRRAGTKPVSTDSLLKWARFGVLLPDGITRLRLEVVRVGGRVLTSKEALDRWLTRLNREEGAPDSPASGPRKELATA